MTARRGAAGPPRPRWTSASRRRPLPLRALAAGVSTAALASVVVLTLTLLTALAPQPLRGGTPASAAELKSALNQTLRAYVAARPLVPGAAISVTGSGLHVETAAGRRSLPNFLPGSQLSTADPFRSASVAKTFTAAAVLRLTETAALALDDRVGLYLPADLVDRLNVPNGDVPNGEVRDGEPLGRRVTVRQLLNHTSGVYDYGTDLGWMARVAASPQRAWQPRDLVDYALSHGQPYADPGLEFHYSDTGYVLLAMILERVTEQPLANAYRQLLPLHRMPTTWLEGREPAPPGVRRRSSQYAAVLDLTHRDPSYDTFGGGGLVTTVADLDTFANALFTGAVFSRPETLATMLTTAVDSDGYGLGIGRRTLGGETVWLHTGFLGAALAYVPRLQLSLAVTTNQTLATPDPLLAVAIELARPLATAASGATPTRVAEAAELNSPQRRASQRSRRSG